MSDVASLAMLIGHAASLLRELTAVSQVIHQAQAEGRKGVSAAELRVIKATRIEARNELEEAIARAEVEGR